MADRENLVNKKIILRFSAQTVEQPMVYHLVKDYNLVPNIIKAQISPENEGFLLLGISGLEEDFRQAMNYLQELGLQVQSLTEHVIRDEDSCTQCGLCTGVCPSNALYLERPSQQVHFDGEKCVVCNICIDVCPTRAMQIAVDN
ncbi:MAG: 4Fe-4S binding protein [Clostridiales bacterium]|nr:4Fe-4S binding protein [Clostridiales bacterium]